MRHYCAECREELLENQRTALNHQGATIHKTCRDELKAAEEADEHEIAIPERDTGGNTDDADPAVAFGRAVYNSALANRQRPALSKPAGELDEGDLVARALGLPPPGSNVVRQ